MRILTLILCVMSLSGLILAQNSGEQVFQDDVIHEIKFNFDQANYWNQMTRNYETTEVGGDHTYVMATLVINGEEVDSVGVRFKGFTSYGESDKKPFKIDFNEFVDDQRFDGLRKLNLNNATGDPAMLRDVLCYKLLRDMGVKAPRTSWAKLYINDTYWGLYQVIEQVDKSFLKDNFADNDGNLFKNLGWSFLEWLGSDYTAYEESFKLKTNKTENDWTGFVNLMAVINNSTDQEFKETISDYFNVDLFLKTLVVDIATDNWDSFMEHGRNWYMYEDLNTGIFHWIPWDYNFAMSSSFEFGEGCDLIPDFIAGTNGSTKVDFTNISIDFGCTEVKYKWDFGDGMTSTEQSPSHVYAVQGTYTACLESIGNDNITSELCKTFDTNDNPADCESILNGSCPHPADAVFSLIVELNPFCCSEWSDDCEEFHSFLGDFINGGFGGTPFGTFTIDQSNNDRVLIQRLMAVPDHRMKFYDLFCDLTTNIMTEDKMHEAIDSYYELIADEVQEDPNSLFDYDIFLQDIGAMNDSMSLKGYFTQRIDNLMSELDSIHNCEPLLAPVEFQEVVINEFVASNDSIGGQMDPDGGYPDWIELYNTTMSSIDLSGVFVSDDKDNLRKWEFPSGTSLDEDDYLILWADNDLNQQGLHVAFKLSKGGESIYLSNPDGSIIDSINYEEQKTNIAYARIPNGTGDFTFWTTTIGRNNEEGISSVADSDVNSEMRLFPNPSNNLVYVESKSETGITGYSVIGMDGVNLITGKTNASLVPIDISQLSAGTYTIKLETDRGFLHYLKLLKID